MRKKKRHNRLFAFFLLANILVIGFAFVYYVNKKIPNEIKILVGNEEEFSFNIPIGANIETEDLGVISVNDMKVPSNQIKIDLNKTFTIRSSQTGKYNVGLKLFGIFKFKDISLDIIEDVELIPCGNPMVYM